MSLNSFGQFALFFSWCFCLFALFNAVWGIRNNAKVIHARSATVLSGLCNVIAITILAVLFVQSDFSNLYVWQHSNLGMHWVYKITAIWGGMDGSMHLWSMILTTMTMIVAWQARKHNERLQPYLYLVLNSSTFFFLTLVLFYTNPFKFIGVAEIPPDGNGLNPLLQNPYMAIHPPLLYLGFTGFAIPYAFCMASLLAGNLGNSWIKAVSKWTLIAWAFLTAGISMGGYWAYIELGWGGFWAWDPVENSSFMPWLTGTAFLHSVLVQERKGLLKTWNIALVVATYGLTIYGTFLTRSGIVQSVHAFAETDIGWVFLLYLSLLILFAMSVVIWRRNELKADQQFEAIFSRETFFLANNLIFVSICFATFWGVMFPVFSEALTGKKQAVGIPFFNMINVPLFLIMLLLMAVGPLVPWNKGSFQQFRKTVTLPLILAVILGLILIWSGIESYYAFIAYFLSAFVIFSMFTEYHRVAKRVQASSERNYLQSVKKAVKSNKRRFAGYFVHIGVAIATIAITASMSAKKELEFSLALGESRNFGEYRLELNELKEINNDNYLGLKSILTVYRKETDLYTTLEPELRRYIRSRESTSEVALTSGFKNDLYVVLAGLNSTGERASFKAYINPLQVWLWLGIIIIVLGTLLIILDHE